MMMTMSRYTQRDWDRVVGWGKVPEEYMMPSSEDLMIQRILQNELDRMEVLNKGLYTDQEVIIRNWLMKRIEEVSNDTGSKK